MSTSRVPEVRDTSAAPPVRRSDPNSRKVNLLEKKLSDTIKDLEEQRKLTNELAEKVRQLVESSASGSRRQTVRRPKLNTPAARSQIKVHCNS